MSEPTSQSPVPSPHDPAAYTTPALFQPQNALVRIGGALGIAGASLGLMIFFVACAGFDAALRDFPVIPLILGGVGLVLSLTGVLLPRHAPIPDTNFLAALFVNVIGILGALVEIAVWQKWPIFPVGNG